MSEVLCNSEVSDPARTWASDPRRVRRARLFLHEAHLAGAVGVEALQAHGIAHSWDPETIHLGISLEGTPHCGPEGLCEAGRLLHDIWRSAVEASHLDPTDRNRRKVAEAAGRHWDHQEICFFSPEACVTCGVGDAGDPCARCGGRKMRRVV